MPSDLVIESIENFYDASYSQQLLCELLKYEFEDLCFYGRNYIPRRKIIRFGENGLCYNFSGTSVPAQPWTATLLSIKQDVEKKTGQSYNYALLNLHPDGFAKIAAHKDDKEDLEAGSIVSTISLGATRALIFSRKDFPSHKVQLKSGSLLLIKPPTNEYWTHEILVQPQVNNPLISVTFRNIRPKDIVEFPRKRHLEIPEDDWLTRLYAPAKRTSVCLKEWDLGYGLKVEVHCFDSRLFVHMRQYSQQGHQGIVMNMPTFQDFQQKISRVDTKYATSSIICNNQLLVISIPDEIIFKQMFHFELKNTFLKMNDLNLMRLKEVIIPQVYEYILEAILTIVLPNSIVNSISQCDYVPSTHAHLKHELISALKTEIDSNVNTLFRCEGCVINDPSQNNHACITMSSETQRFNVSDDSLLILNVKNVMDDLNAKNVLQFYSKEFFNTVSYEEMKREIML